MSDRGSSEAVQIRLGLEENDESPWEYGTYIERNDGRDGKDDWVPLVYGGNKSWEDARKSWMRECNFAATHPRMFRNPRIVRRAVSPWEVIGDE